MAQRRFEGTGLSRQKTIDQHEAGYLREEIDQRNPPRDRSPLQDAGKQDDEQKPPPENWHRISDQCSTHHALIDPAATLDGSQNPGRNPYHCRKDDGTQRQFNCRRKQRHEFIKHWSLGNDRGAEVTLQDINEIIVVLDRKRLIETQRSLQLRIACGIYATLARKQHDRIAGKQPNEGEGHD